MASQLNFRQEDKKWKGNVELNQSKDFINKENLEISLFDKRKDDWRKYCEIWKAYPDLFIDFIKPENSRFKFYFYQRVYLRVLVRYREVFLTATRGTSKSFLEILTYYLLCIFYPNAKYFITAPGKEQASKIAQQNIEDIWNFFPLLKNEVKYFSFNKDYTKLVFTNDAKLDIVQIENSSRGGRRHGGAAEEVADPAFKEDLFNEVILPLMANNRMASNNKIDLDTEIHKRMIYVTTAGTKQSFGYGKCKETLEKMVDGKSAFCLGNSYELPCMHGQLDINYIEELQQSSNFNKLGFDREYGSIWTGSSDKSLVNYEDLVACRSLSKFESKHCGDKDCEYILAYDVSRSEGSKNASCSLAVFKIIPKGNGEYFKYLVNIYCFEGTHFKEQSLFLKQKVDEFKARILIVDHNGLGKGLTDFLVIETGEYPPYAVINDERFDKYKTEKSIPIVYALCSQNKETKDSDMINNFMNTVSNHRINFLVPEAIGSKELIGKRKVEGEEFVKLTIPYINTDILMEEVMNLEYIQAGRDTKIKQISKKINKDKFSSVMYGLYWIYLEEQRNKQSQEEESDWVSCMNFN